MLASTSHYTQACANTIWRNDKAQGEMAIKQIGPGLLKCHFIKRTLQIHQHLNVIRIMLFN
jgi:hypothetical protein